MCVGRTFKPATGVAHSARAASSQTRGICGRKVDCPQAAKQTLTGIGQNGQATPTTPRLRIPAICLHGFTSPGIITGKKGSPVEPGAPVDSGRLSRLAERSRRVFARRTQRKTGPDAKSGPVGVLRLRSLGRYAASRMAVCGALERIGTTKAFLWGPGWQGVTPRTAPLKYSSSGNNENGSSSRNTRPSFCWIR